MSEQEILAALYKFAAADLLVARKEGHVHIADSKEGVLTLVFSEGVYTLSSAIRTIIAGGWTKVRDAMLPLYQVEIVE